MTHADRPLKRVLLTNDDGIEADGLAVLEQVAASLAEEVWTVAPMHDQSGTSHAISMHQPLRLSARGERRFAVSGTPSDCVVMGLRHLLAEEPPELVLSGINHGMNIGHEVMYSGTASAAIVAAWLGTPSIALSQAFRKPRPLSFDAAAAYAAPIIRQVLEQALPERLCLNINFPPCAPQEVSEVRLTRQGDAPIFAIAVEGRVDIRGKDYFWLGFEPSGAEQDAGSDLVALRDNAVSITPLRFDRSDEALMEAFGGRFDAIEPALVPTV